MSSYTDDLLSELKETVAADVAAEEARLQAEMQARAAAEEQAARRAEAVRQAEIEARLEAERQRRRLAVEIRRSAGRATEADAAGAEPVIPGARGPVERLDPLTATPAPAAQGHGAGFYFVVMGLPLLCITAIVVAWILSAPQVQLETPQNPLAGQVEAPERPVIEVADPGPTAEGAETPVSAELPADAPEDDAAEEEKKAPETKTGKPADKPKPRDVRRGDRKPTPAKPETPKPGLGGGLNLGDMNDIMKAD